MKLKIFLVTAAVSIGALALGAGGAQAHEVSCEFSGLAATVMPDGAGAGIQSIQTDIADGGLQTFPSDFDTGNHAYSGPATCVSRQPPLLPTVQNALITASGDYQNRICGTGAIDADAMTIDLPPGPDDVSVTYVVELRNWIGTGTASGVAGGHPLTGNVAIAITPSAGNCVTTDVSQFAVAGTIELTGP